MVSFPLIKSKWRFFLAQNRPKVTWHKLTEAGEVRVAKSYNYQVKYGGGYKDIVELRPGFNEVKQVYSQIKCGAFSRSSSSLYCPMRNSDQMTIRKTYHTLPSWYKFKATDVLFSNQWSFTEFLSPAVRSNLLDLNILELIECQFSQF